MLKKYYEILGLEEGASEQEVNDAFERLNKNFDPSKNDNLDFFIEEHALIVDAYNKIINTLHSYSIKDDSCMLDNANSANFTNDNTAESIFEIYKSSPEVDKIEYLIYVEQKIISGNQNYKTALDLICRYEKCDSVLDLKNKLVPENKISKIENNNIDIKYDKKNTSIFSSIDFTNVDENIELIKDDLVIEKQEDNSINNDDIAVNHKYGSEKKEDKKEKKVIQYFFIGFLLILFFVLVKLFSLDYFDGTFINNNNVTKKVNEVNHDYKNVEFYTTIEGNKSDDIGNYVIEGETFKLNFNLGFWVTSIYPPWFDGFEIVDFPTVNHYTHPLPETIISYKLRAIITGNLIIKSATIRIGDSIFNSTPTEIRVFPKNHASIKPNNTKIPVTTESKSKDTKAELDINTAESLFSEGIVYFNSGLYELALNNFLQAQRLSPSNGKYLYNLALAFSKTGDNNSACIYTHLAKENGYRILVNDPMYKYASSSCSTVKIPSFNNDNSKSESDRFTISGIVQDNKGRPLPGAAIQIKGYDYGVTSDFDGNFSIRVKKGDVLLFSFLRLKYEFVVDKDISFEKLYVTLVKKGSYSNIRN